MNHCPHCTSEVPEASRFCGQCGSDVTPMDAATQTSVGESDSGTGDRRVSTPSQFSPTATGIGRLSSSDTLDDARFLPGLMIADRYRVIGLLGKGGMGEVYRADDMKLGVPVALKFLPERLEQDEGRLQRFLNEVRVAREVSHANVCRVYDIGELDPSTGSGRGRHFLSMEFVDGEDLASLLRRIGRVGDDKALQIARQICAGLAAAHAKGIVHRDLKPANVMIDGDGQVRITDFGLAGLAEGFEGAEIRVGTPAYMSPEQIAGREVTLRSDIYSLGLLLYELFTGKAAFSAPTLAELSRMQQETMPSTPSTVVSGFDPAVESVINRCMEKDPTLRPVSALAVAAALPGGDPLAAALAAGETPSPEMVAAAGETGGLTPLAGLAYLALILIGIVGLIAISEQWVFPRQFAMTKPPQALVVEARELARGLGYDGPSKDSTYGYSGNGHYFDYVREHDQSPERWRSIGTIQPSLLTFWYRESPEPLVPLRAEGSASFDNPPMRTSGMLRLRLSTEGRLISFLAVPPQRVEQPPVAEAPDWAALFAAAGLDENLLEPAAPEWNPLIDCSHRAAWTGAYPGQPEVPIRIEAGGFDAKPTYFEVVAAWDQPERMVGANDDSLARRAEVFVVVALYMLIVAALFLARRNLKKGRGDKRGAYAMAGYTFLLVIGAWALAAHHVLSIGEVGMLGNALQGALFVAAVTWILYVALEPYMRRLWPDALISWSRLLAGHVRDPMVGRDLLLGSAAGVALAVGIVLARILPGWMGHAGRPPVSNSVATLPGARQVMSLLLEVQLGALLVPVGVFLLILLARLVVRKQWIAVGLALVIMTLMQGLQGSASLLGWTLSACIWTLLIWIIVRRGLLAAVFTFVYANLLLTLPLTSDLSSWYAGRAWLGIGLLTAVALYGYYISSLAGRTVFVDNLLEQT